MSNFQLFSKISLSDILRVSDGMSLFDILQSGFFFELKELSETENSFTGASFYSWRMKKSKNKSATLTNTKLFCINLLSPKELMLFFLMQSYHLAPIVGLIKKKDNHLYPAFTYYPSLLNVMASCSLINKNNPLFDTEWIVNIAIQICHVLISLHNLDLITGHLNLEDVRCDEHFKIYVVLRHISTDYSSETIVVNRLSPLPSAKSSHRLVAPEIKADSFTSLKVNIE